MSFSPYRIDRDVPGTSTSRAFDLVIIGGGITGVSLAREAAGRGLRAVLLESSDFGSGTSAATTKYIHGGIRYLEQYDIGVVRESLRERRILALGAPHLVEQTRFIMPAWRWSKPPTALIGAGVMLYDLLAFDRNRHAPPSLQIPHPRWMSRRDVRAAVPWLDPQGLQGAFAYHDTLNVHPERLLLAYAKSAVAAGAVLLNHVTVDGFIFDDQTKNSSRLVVRGVRFSDQLTGVVGEIRASVVVNAAGPWIDRVLATVERPTGVGVERSKGVHILTRPLGGPGRVSDAVFARAQSGRHVIVSPWQGRSFIGPTDTPIDDDQSSVVVDPTDIDLILDTVNSTMSGVEVPLTAKDVELATVGVRPLIRKEQAGQEFGDVTMDSTASSTYSASRAHEFYHHVDCGIENVWTIGGGKWTTARATAEQMVDQLLRYELRGVRTRSFSTRCSQAAGSFAWAEDAEPYLVDVVEELGCRNVPALVAEHLARLYGTEWRLVAELIEVDSRLGAQIGSKGPDIAAQVVFAVTHESAHTLSDIVDRRLVMGTVGVVSRDDLQRVAELAGPLWGWDEQRIDHEVRREFDRRQVIEAHWKTPTLSRLGTSLPTR